MYYIRLILYSILEELVKILIFAKKADSNKNLPITLN